MITFQRKSVALFALVVTTGSLVSCASIRKRQNAEPPAQQMAQQAAQQPSGAEKTPTAPAQLPAAVVSQPTTPPQPAEREQAASAGPTAGPTAQEYKKLQTQITQLNARLASIENRLGSVTENLNTTRTHLENLVANQKAKPAPVVSHSAERGGSHAESPAVGTDPHAGFSDDAATRTYRRSMILFKAQRYRDSAASFSDFLEKYPDHPLAGTAQFYVGESYFMEGEYRLAVQEFQRVLTSYDRSAYVAQTLREMAEAEDRLKRTEDAARHRQLLTSLFPHSPFAVLKTAKATQTEPEQRQEPVRQPIPEQAPAPHSHSKLDEPPLNENMPMDGTAP